MKDYYAILGVTPQAEDVVIKAAYRALAQRYHPDRFVGSPEEALTRPRRRPMTRSTSNLVAGLETLMRGMRLRTKGLSRLIRIEGRLSTILIWLSSKRRHRKNRRA